MSENTLQWIQILKLLICVGAAGLYGFGGVSGKWKRRFIAPAILTAGIMGISAWVGTMSYWYLFFYPILLGAWSMGYGVNSKLMKLFKNKITARFVVGVLVSLAALPIAIVTGSWMLMILHLFLCALISSVFGAFNPTQSARAEETTIGFMAAFIPLMGMI